MKQLAFFFDASACSGCKTCQVACKDKHDSPAGVRWRRVYEVCGGDWRKEGAAWVHDISSYHVSMACNHCQEPICLKACPNAAIVKDEEGVVLIDYDRCMGCRYCEWTCPYGALQYDRQKRRMTKCTFCRDYLSQGKAPACISACPMRVIDCGELKELEERHGAGSEQFPLPREKYTRPALVLKPHAHTRAAGAKDIHIVNEEEVR